MDKTLLLNMSNDKKFKLPRKKKKLFKKWMKDVRSFTLSPKGDHVDGVKRALYITLRGIHYNEGKITEISPE